MNRASEAAALAGWSENPRAPIEQRLAASKQALDFYVDGWGKLEDLLEAWRVRAESDNPSEYLDMSEMVESLREILDPQ